MTSNKIIINDKQVIDDKKIYAIRSFEENYLGDSFGYKLEWTQAWANDSGIKKSLIYEKQTLWYLIDYFFEWGAIRVKDAPYFGEILYWIDISENINKRLKPESVQIDINDKLRKEIISRVFRKYNIKIINDNSFKLKKNDYGLKYILLKYRLRFRSLMLKKKENFEKTQVICLSTDRFANLNNKEDYLWGNLVSEFDKEMIQNEILVYDRLWYFQSWKDVRNKIKTDDKTKSFIGQYYDKNVFKKMKEIHLFIKKTGNKLLKDDKFRKSLNYKDIEFFDMIENRFRFVFNAFSYEVGDCLAITEKIIKKRNPKIIFIDHEDNFYGKGFMINAKKTNARTKIAALQYELVYPGCIAMHIKEDTSGYLWRPLPNIKFAGGDYVKNILISKCNYKKNNVIKVVGQPRYDTYFKMNKNNNEKEKLKKELGIPSGKKIITYASSDSFVEIGSLEHVVDFVKNNNDFFLVIKIHPSADKNEFWKLFDIKQKNIIAKKDIDLKKLLPISDLLISRGSTVAMESMIFDVPVILMSTNTKCPIPYEKYNSVIIVSDKAELSDKIKLVFTNNKIRNELKEGRKIFLKEYLGFDDGNSSERVSKYIKEILMKNE